MSTTVLLNAEREPHVLALDEAPQDDSAGTFYPLLLPTRGLLGKGSVSLCQVHACS